MSMRLLLVVALTLVFAGCAEGPAGGGVAPPTEVPSTAEAAGVLAQASSSVPDRYGVTMDIARAGVSLARMEAVVNEPAKTSYFSIRFDPAFLASQTDDEEMGMSGFDPSVFRDVSVYSSPEGNALLVNGTVLLTEPGEQTPWSSSGEGGGEDPLGDLTDPEGILEELGENVTITSVTPTTLRGKPAIQMEGTQTDEDGAHPFTVWLFTEPTRVARLQMALPEDEEDPAMSGATMTMDMLYDDEVTLAVPAGLTRALGLRFESDRSGGAFSLGGSEENAPETWTFQASGGIPLAEVQAEVGSMGDDEALWTMPLTAGTKTQDGVTLTFHDNNNDAKVSEGDTLTIARGDEGMGMQVALRDLETGYRIVPAGGLLLGVALAGAAIAARRRP